MEHLQDACLWWIGVFREMLFSIPILVNTTQKCTKQSESNKCLSWSHKIVDKMHWVAVGNYPRGGTLKLLQLLE